MTTFLLDNIASMLHRDTYMTQRTFNEINACSADEPCEEDMETEPVPKSKRGRKRQSDEACLTEGERIRKEKNRKAAQKCREKKEKEAKDLKNRNEELEAENKKLSDDKKKLEERAREFHKIIRDHIAKGCKLPSDVQELYNEDAKMISHTCADEVFRAVGIIERDHTPPHTPEDFSHENMSQNVHYRFNNSRGFSGASPTALFSGTPLLDSGMAKRNGSASRSSSSSPVPPMSRVNADLSLARQNNVQLFTIKPSQFSSITTRQVETLLHGDTNQSVHQSGQILPTVVSELDDQESNSTSEYTAQSFTLFDQESKPMETDLDMPNNWPLNLAKQASSESNSIVNEERGQNLPSLGFSCVSDYSYTKDLQQLESVQEIIEYTNDGNENQSQRLHSDKKKSSGPSSGQSVSSEKKNPSIIHHDSQPVIDINVGALALLDMATEMAESLRQQIKTNFINSLNSEQGTMSMPGENQRNGFTHQGADQAEGSNLKSDLSQQQQVYLLKQQQWAANGQTNLEAPKEEQCLGNQSLFIRDLSAQVQVIMKPDMVSTKNCSVQSQHSAQMQETLQPVQCPEPRQIQRQFSGQNLPCLLQSSRVSQEQQMQQPYAGTQVSQDVFQVRQQQTRLGSSASKPVPSHLSNISSTITSAQAVGYTLPNTGLYSRPGLQPSSLAFTCISSPHDSTASRLLPQQTQDTKPHQSNEFFKNVQIRDGYSQLAPSSATAQEQSLNPESSAGASENIDYGANVEDLPSLNFLELQSDSNLFEKKPSRLAS